MHSTHNITQAEQKKLVKEWVDFLPTCKNVETLIETESYSTPLGWAARHGQKVMVEWLLKKGADLSQPKNKLWVPAIRS